MAILPDEDRKDIWVELMQQYSRDGESIGIVKADLRATVDAIDTWLQANGASLNAAIPEPARTALTQKQKALAVSYVINKRYLSEV